jgi:trimethylamine---corrinoid protein Co-methyltransferase
MSNETAEGKGGEQHSQGARTSRGRDRRARGGGREGGAGIRQLPFKRLRNPYKPIEILNEEQLERIHDASMRLLESVGMEVMHPESIDNLAKAGASVERETGRVRMGRDMVMDLVARAPSEFSIRARNPEHDLTIGGNHLVFTSVGGPAYFNDIERGKRPGNFPDMCDYIRLVQSLNVLHQEGGGPGEPVELPAASRHLDFYRTALTLTDKTWQCWGLGGYRVRDAIDMLCIALDATKEDLLAKPAAITVINSNSPLRLDIPMGEGLTELARHGQAVAVTPFTLAGAMSPVSLAGALALQNAEALFMVALTQIVRPGTPVIYGAFTSNVDMKSGSPAFGTPEYAKAAIISGQLARRYKLPLRSSNVNASNAVDVQAAYESEMALWSTIMGGANYIVHAAGWLEGGLTASFEKLIVDAEMLQMMREFLEPPVIDEAELAIEAIREVGPGGHFFGVGHTLERYERAFYAPMLSDWRNFESWREAGAEDGTQRAHKIWKQLLKDYEEPPIDPGVREALDAYVANRRKEIEAGKL